MNFRTHTVIKSPDNGGIWNSNEIIVVLIGLAFVLVVELYYGIKKWNNVTSTAKNKHTLALATICYHNM